MLGEERTQQFKTHPQSQLLFWNVTQLSAGKAETLMQQHGTVRAGDRAHNGPELRNKAFLSFCESLRITEKDDERKKQ